MLKLLNYFFTPKTRRRGEYSYVLSDNLAAVKGFVDFNSVSLYASEPYLTASQSINGFAKFLLIFRGDRFVGGVPLHRVNLLKYSSGYSGFILPKSATSSDIEVFFHSLNIFVSTSFFLSFVFSHGFSARKFDLEIFNNLYVACASFPKAQIVPTRFLNLSGFSSFADTLLIFPSKIRSQIRKSCSDSISVSFRKIGLKNDENLSDLVRDYVSFINLCRAETNMSLINFDDCLSEFEGNILSGLELLVGSIKVEGRLVGMALFHVFGDVALYAQGGSLAVGRQSGSYSILMVESFSELSKTCCLIELGRVDRTLLKTKNIDEFKANFTNKVLFGLKFEHTSVIYRIGLFLRRFARKF